MNTFSYKTYCAAMFNTMWIGNSRIKPCCWFQQSELKDNKYTSIDEMSSIFNGNEFQNLRNKMLKGERIEGCKTCYNHESVGGESHRLRYNSVMGFTKTKKLTMVDLYMGNLCNLACMMCNSGNSSKWILDEKLLYGEADTKRKWNLDIDNLDINTLKDVNTIKLAGGEVLYMQEHKQLLDKLISHDIAKQITLVYVVNTMVSPKEFENRWKNFKEILIIFSIDGVDEVNTYIRHLSNWVEVTKNINQYFNLDINVSFEINTTVSILNVYHLDDIHYWAHHHKIGKVFFRILDKPKQLSINNLPDDLRLLTINKLEKLKELKHIIEVLKKPYDGDITESINHIRKIDKLRNNDFFKVNPQYNTLQ